MQGWKFSRQLKLEAVKLVRDRGMAVAQVARNLGWLMSDTMAAQLVTNTLIIAIWRRGKPDALLHHSYQGIGCNLSSH